MKAWIQTYTGRRFWPIEPSVDDICIEDIAHALAHQCRFNGHCREFYSVAEHSMRVAGLIAAKGFSEFKLAGLLHDGSEAYLADVARPIKPELKGYQEIECQVQGMIDAKFGSGVSEEVLVLVKHCDVEALAWEARDLMNPARLNEWDWEGMGFPRGPLGVDHPPIRPLTPKQAKQRFLECFYQWQKSN